VASHATRFCDARCKADWHWKDEDGANARGQRRRAHAKAAEKLLTMPPRQTPLVNAAYQRALRADPCAYCGAPAEASDHIVPKSHGGPDDWSNRTAACHACNNSKMQTPLLTFLAWRRARDEFEPWRRVVAAIHTRSA